MSRSFSVYLDLVRFLAAFVVLLNHCSLSMFGIASHVFPGHDAVIVFFVLSGYVIAFVTDRRDKQLHVYALNRLSRLWSVAIPATILGLIVHFLAVDIFTLKPVLWALANIFFLGEGWWGILFGEEWWVSITSPQNPPMWSLNYEAWYYIVFASWWFFQGWSKIVLVSLSCIGAGPKILLLMPLWLAGVFLYWRRPTIGRKQAFALLLSAPLIYLIFYICDAQVFFQSWLRSITSGRSYLLGPSTSVFNDYLVACLFISNMIAAENLLRGVEVGKAMTFLSKWLASYTLSLYLFHWPLNIMISQYWGLDGALGFLLLLILVIMFGCYTEHRRDSWRTYLRKMLGGAWRGGTKVEVMQNVGRSEMGR